LTSAAGRPVLHDADSLAASRSTVADQFLTFFAFVLGGYAIGSKGFAYLGVPPIYIGEFSLFVGLAALWYARATRTVLRSPTIRLLLAFMLYGALRTIPYVRESGLYALRDAALWGYGLFSIIVAGVILSRPDRISYLVARYRRFVPLFLVAAPLVWVGTILFESLSRWMGMTVPTWPGTNVPLLLVKAGDLLVHFGGVAAFMCVGLAGRSRPWRVAVLVVSVALTAMSRGGLLAFASAYIVAFAARPRSRTGWQIATIVVTTIAVLGITGLELRFPGNDRAVSFRQLVQHVQTTTGSSASSGPAQDLENTKEWRLAWWAVIVGYTIGGDYRWGGKGYGVNLATDDGFQVTDDDSLRSPHNAHMTVLARSGVIGLALWLLLQGAWFLRIVRALREAGRNGDVQWHALFAFLLAYWLALLVNATFDVYLEGPAGGIWFWSVFGLGIAAETVYRSASMTSSTAIRSMHGASGRTQRFSPQG